jgi:hypothetical protein
MKVHKHTIDDFISVINSIYGVYLDSTLGFKLLNEHITKFQNKSVKLIGPEATVEKLDKAEFIYGTGTPPQYKIPNDRRVLHMTTQGELKERNKENGINFKVIGNLSVVLLYQYWEEKYREAIATSNNLKINELKAPIFGELRHLRVAILHNNGIATIDVERKVQIVRFKQGEDIFLTRENLREIINTIKDYLESLKS